MTKTELYTTVSAAIAEYCADNKAQKHAEALQAIIDQYLQPKNNAGINPPKEIDGVMHYYCRFHQRYEAEDAMVMSAGKSKGYCRASISVWNKNNATIKKLNKEAVDAMSAGDFELAQQLANEAQELSAKLNDVASFDYEADWATFNAK